MIHYYRFHPKLKMFDPASCELRVGDVVCHKDRVRRVRSVSPLRLGYATGGSFCVDRSEVVVLPEYTREHPQRIGVKPPGCVRAPHIDTGALCDQVGLALGQMLQHSAHRPIDIEAFFADTTRDVLLRTLLNIHHPFELEHWKRVVSECHRTDEPTRARCFRGLLLGRCLAHHLSLSGGSRSVAEQNGFGAFQTLVEPVEPIRRDLSSASPIPERPTTVRGVFMTMLRMAVPPPHLRVEGGDDRHIEVRDPGLCALYLDRMMHRLREPASGRLVPPPV